MDNEVLVVELEESKPSYELKSLLNLKVATLKLLCKQKGVKVSGKKESLISRLLESHVVLPKPETKKKVRRKKGVSSKTKKLIEKLQEKGYLKLTTLRIRKNNLGRYQCLDPELNGLIFDEESKKIYARQDKDGNLIPLVRADVDLCLKNNLPFEVPLNMNIGMEIIEDDRLKEELGEDDFLEVPSSEGEQSEDDS